MDAAPLSCPVCGGTEFRHRAVLRKELVAEWQLASHEESCVNQRQGTACAACGANLRSMALANAIRTAAGTALTLAEFVETPQAHRLALLEINGAGDLGAVLRRLPGHALAARDVDMRSLPCADDAYDFVVHSDMLEHVAHPIRALEECRRVLRPGGTLCFTVPAIVGRLSRSREGLPKSFHASPDGGDDCAVQTEFGADMWTYVLRAGFAAVSISAVGYPAALALSAVKAEPAATPRRADPAGPLVKPQRTVSVHFPKAAGSSLKSQFDALLGDQAFFDYGHDPLVVEDRQAVAFPAGKRLVHGHFHPSRYDPTDGYWLTFLRHPVDNLLSIYFFWIDRPEPDHDLHARFLRERPSVLEFAAYPGISTLMSETYFGGFDMRRFDFIGFHETRASDLRRLGADLGLPLVAEAHENRTAETTERREIKADAALRRRLADLLAADMAFYERLRR